MFDKAALPGNAADALVEVKEEAPSRRQERVHGSASLPAPESS
jgi:hypothetical protein